MAGGYEKIRGLSSLGTAKAVEMREGIVRRTLVYGEKLLLCHWTIRAGIQFGEHTHPYEQAGYVLRGRLRMIIDGEPRELGPGSSYLVPSDVKHDAVALDEVEVLDVFSPLREEYID